MAIGKLGSKGGFSHGGALGTPGASAYGDGPPPNGFHWEFVTDDTDGSRITDDVTGQPVVDLVAN